jgi:hypothetical protein
MKASILIRYDAVLRLNELGISVAINAPMIFAISQSPLLFYIILLLYLFHPISMSHWAVFRSVTPKKKD